MRPREAVRRLVEFLEADDDPREPVYDPVQLAGALIASLAAAGALYWLLWTLLVYEGGLFVKLAAGLEVLFTDKTPADFGWKGAHDRGLFEGLTANALALILTLGAAAFLHKLHGHRASRGR